MNSWQTADEIAAGSSLRLKTIQNVLATMCKESPRPFAMDGAGTKSDPRRYRTLAPHFDGFGADDPQEMIPPDDVPRGNGGGGNHFRGISGEAGNDIPDLWPDADQTAFYAPRNQEELGELIERRTGVRPTFGMQPVWAITVPASDDMLALDEVAKAAFLDRHETRLRQPGFGEDPCGY